MQKHRINENPVPGTKNHQKAASQTCKNIGSTQFYDCLLFRNSIGAEKHLNFAEKCCCRNAQIIKIYRCSKAFEFCRKLLLPQQKNLRNRIECHKNHSQASGVGHGHGYGMASATAVVVRCCHTIAMATSMAIAMAQAKGTAAIALAMAMAVAIGTATAMDMPMAMDGHRYGHGTNEKIIPYFRCDTNF